MSIKSFCLPRRTWMLSTASSLGASVWAAWGSPGAWAAPVELDCTPEKYPALTIGGDDVSRDGKGKPSVFRGFADPCLRKDPVSGLLWLAYSWPHVETFGKGFRKSTILGVETHLASSRDNGKSWQREQMLWPRTPARFHDAKKGRARDGFLSHEVPNFLPCAIDGLPAWVGVRLDYFLGQDGNYKDRDNLSFCFRLMVAPTPQTLSNAPYVTFGHDKSSPECQVNINVCDYSKDFPPLFIPNEPALYFENGRLYLAFVVMTFYGQSPDFPKSFIAVFSTAPGGDVQSWKWAYHGKLASYAEARELGGDALTQLELAQGRDGKLLALLTPETFNAKAAKEFGGDAFGGIMHHGCVVVEVASLSKPALARDASGRIAVRARLHSSTQSERGPGAATYDPNSATGVIFTLRDLSDKANLAWSLHATGLHP